MSHKFNVAATLMWSNLNPQQSHSFVEYKACEDLQHFSVFLTLMFLTRRRKQIGNHGETGCFVFSSFISWYQKQASTTAEWIGNLCMEAVCVWRCVRKWCSVKWVVLMKWKLFGGLRCLHFLLESPWSLECDKDVIRLLQYITSNP